MAHIVICDDNREIAHALSIYMRQMGHTSTEVYNGSDLQGVIQSLPQVDLILLDVMMPGMDGIEALQVLRRESNIPVILVSAKSEQRDVLQGLQAGADDYVTKPFQPRELQARIAAQLRRFQILGSQKDNQKEQVWQTGELILDEGRRACYLGKREISLTQIEWRILRTLFQSLGQTLTAKEIYERSWNQPCFGGENVVTVHIRHLREKIEVNPSRPVYIRVVWGRGYQLIDMGGTRPSAGGDDAN